MAQKRAHLMQQHDDLRQLLLHEPRGYPCQNLDLVFPSALPEAAYGFVIAEQGAIYPMMSGHNAMCVATVLLETGMVASTAGDVKFALEAPAGIVEVSARVVTRVDEAPIVESVGFVFPTAFARPRDLDLSIAVPELGDITEVRVDVAYGSGMIYCVCDAEAVGLAPLEARRGLEIVTVGEAVKRATRRAHPVAHPENGYEGPDILVFTEPPVRREDGALAARNTVVMSLAVPEDEDEDHASASNDVRRRRQTVVTPKAVLDRSPCGTGTCAVMAVLHARGQLAVGQDFWHTSIVGSTFRGRLLAENVRVGDDDDPVLCGVTPYVEGRAWITQHATVVLDPTDPFPTGLPQVGDLW